MRGSARWLSVATLSAAQLAPTLNGYTLAKGPPKTIRVPNASQLTSLQEVSVAGTLLKKQTIALDPAMGARKVSLGANGGAYGIEADGDLHFCLGGKPLTPHITCEVQHAAPWLGTFKASVGTPVTATGFFRCLFEHPGFHPNDDAHIFEIHPVRAVDLAGATHSFDIGLPDPQAIHTWLSPHPLNDQDGRIRVAYDGARDVLTFTNMDGQDENYVRVAGLVRDVRPGGTHASAFTLDSPDIGHPIEVLVLPGTTAAKQLGALTSTHATLVALRNIDLAQALGGAYLINLLAIDLQPGT
jgi:hypothetical protein